MSKDPTRVYFYDYDYKTRKHALKYREATVDESGTACIRISPGEVVHRPAGEWISSNMMSHDLKACIHETLKAEVRKEMESKNEA